jgi:hypothetical protein
MAATLSDTRQEAEPRSAAGKSLEERIERLSSVSVKRVIEPDTDVVGQVGDGAVLPPDLLSVAGLDLGLTSEQEARLSREEIASIVEVGIRFESVLIAGVALDLAGAADLTDPRITYALHELGEETRHSRLFVRLLTQLQPKAKNPIDRKIMQRAQRWVLPRLMARPALFDILVLTGEEIPDLFQKLAGEHADTDPFIREVNRYHRQEEARHLAFARLLLPELIAKASRRERWLVRHFAPVMVRNMFDFMVHPGVYATVGLDPWKTWNAARRSPTRVAMRHEAIRPLLEALLDAKAFRPGRIPKGWQDLCGVDRYGSPVPAIG